jgi:hypothetical protein
MVELNADSYLLYRKMRHAKAAWDVVLYAPEYLHEDVPDDIGSALCDAHSDALNAYLLHPVDRIGALHRKLRVFREEEIAEGWHRRGEIVHVLTEDAERCADRLALAEVAQLKAA